MRVLIVTFPKRGRQKLVSRGRTKESELQKLCEDYLIVNNIAFIRIPDAIYRLIFGTPGIPTHIKAMIAEFIRGVPDITILRDNGTYTCLELKTDIGKQSTGQKQFERRVAKNHYFVVRSFEDFRKIVRDG